MHVEKTVLLTKNRIMLYNERVFRYEETVE